MATLWSWQRKVLWQDCHAAVISPYLTAFLIRNWHLARYIVGVKPPVSITAVTALLCLLAAPAAAQIRVDARIHASSGSCANCDLSNRQMNGVRLKNANFSGSLFNNSNLSGGQFDGSDLTGAHFRRALLMRVEGTEVKMAGAVLEDATLTEAVLSNSAMTGINLHRANLARVDFRGNDFRQANLSSAHGKGANFSGSNFSGAKLEHMNLENAKLANSNFQRVKFGDAIFLEADLTGADFSDADMSEAQGLRQAQLDTACGNMNTRLPEGLSLPYCDAAMEDMGVNISIPNENVAAANKRLDRAISDVETILAATPQSNKPLRRRLQRIHSDLMHSKRAIAQ